MTNPGDAGANHVLPFVLMTSSGSDVRTAQYTDCIALLFKTYIETTPMSLVKKSFNLWAITDEHTRYERQATALASALEQGSPQCLRLRPRVPWQWFAPRLLPGAARAYGAGLEQLITYAPPWLAIGCGRQAAAALRLLQPRGTRTVQILNPGLAAHHWDMVIVPEHQRLRGENVLTLCGSLNPVSDEWLNLGRTAFPQFANLPRPRVGLLIGAPRRQAPWKEKELNKQLQLLAAQIQAQNGSILVTTSSRTPPGVRQSVRQLLEALPGTIWCGETTSPNPYTGVLAWADGLICTPDSVHLLSEACATRVPVAVLLEHRARAHLAEFQRDLQTRLRLLDSWEALFEKPGWQLAAEPLRETTRIAAEVAKRMGLNQKLAERFAARSRAVSLHSA